MLDKVIATYQCTACGACGLICPATAIEYCESVAGYVFPRIVESRCIKCGLCEEVCPGTHFGEALKEKYKQHPNGSLTAGYVGRATDDSTWRRSQSGGIVTALLRHLLDSGSADRAVVVALGSERPHATIIEKGFDSNLIQGSQFYPVPILSAMKSLNPREKIALVGLPCHLHGFRNTLDLSSKLRKMDVLTIGLFCDHSIYRAGYDYLASFSCGIGVSEIRYRDTSEGGFPGKPMIYSVDGKSIKVSKNHFRFINGMLMPLRCELCADKLNFTADIACGDPHRIPGVAKDQKLSAVIVNSTRGSELMKGAIKSGAIQATELSPDLIIQGQNLDKRKNRFLRYMSAYRRYYGIVPDYGMEYVTCLDYGREIREIKRIALFDMAKSRRTLIRRIRSIERFNGFCALFSIKTIKRLAAGLLSKRTHGY